MNPNHDRVAKLGVMPARDRARLVLLDFAGGFEKQVERTDDPGATFTEPGTRLDVAIGDEFTIVLESNASTGSAWGLETDLPTEALELVDDTTSAPVPTSSARRGARSSPFEPTARTPISVAELLADEPTGDLVVRGSLFDDGSGLSCATRWPNPSLPNAPAIGSRSTDNPTPISPKSAACAGPTGPLFSTGDRWTAAWYRPESATTPHSLNGEYLQEHDARPRRGGDSCHGGLPAAIRTSALGQRVDGGGLDREVLRRPRS